MDKHKKVIILYFIGLSLFFINPVSAIINGDFEDGNTGWTLSGNGPTYYGDIVSLAANSSSLGLRTMAVSAVGYGYGMQTLDLSGIANIKFDYRTVAGTFNGEARHAIGFDDMNVSNVKWQSTFITADPLWRQGNLDVSGYSGPIDIYFYSRGGAIGSATGHFDNIILEAGDSTISFYPSLTNTTPTHVNFSIVESDEDTEYGLFIYRNVSNVSTYIDYVGWFYDEIGSAPIEIMDYGANCTYEALLWGVHVGDITTCEQEYIFNGSIDPFPTPQPTPNITALPTYTPQPTPTGYPNQSLINNSLNNTWAEAWFNLVEYTITGLFEPVYNFWSWILHPVNLLHNILADFSSQMSVFFDEASNKIVIATGILNTIFLYIPDKIVNLVGYYLLWLCIILVFKGDT